MARPPAPRPPRRRQTVLLIGTACALGAAAALTLFLRPAAHVPGGRAAAGAPAADAAGGRTPARRRQRRSPSLRPHRRPPRAPPTPAREPTGTARSGGSGSGTRRAAGAGIRDRTSPSRPRPLRLPAPAAARRLTGPRSPRRRRCRRRPPRDPRPWARPSRRHRRHRPLPRRAWRGRPRAHPTAPRTARPLEPEPPPIRRAPAGAPHVRLSFLLFSPSAERRSVALAHRRRQPADAARGRVDREASRWCASCRTASTCAGRAKPSPSARATESHDRWPKPAEISLAR